VLGRREAGGKGTIFGRARHVNAPIVVAGEKAAPRDGWGGEEIGGWVDADEQGFAFFALCGGPWVIVQLRNGKVGWLMDIRARVWAVGLVWAVGFPTGREKNRLAVCFVASERGGGKEMVEYDD